MVDPVLPSPGGDLASPWGEGDSFSREHYRPLRALTAWLIGLLSAICILDILSVGMSVIGILLLNRVVSAPAELPAGSVAVLEMAETTFAGLRVLQWLATVVVFLVWFRRAYRNLLAFDAMGAMRYAPGWAIGAWFVPFLNLVRPKRIMDDIWRASDPKPHVRSANSRDVTPPRLIMVWWITWLVTQYTGRLAFNSFWAAETVPQLLDSYRWAVAVDVFDMIAAVLAIAVVLQVSNRQTRRATELAREGQLPPVFRHPSYV